MDSGDWVQSSIGILGVLATLVVARTVLKLERKDRQSEESRTVERETKIHEDAKRSQRKMQRDEWSQRRNDGYFDELSGCIVELTGAFQKVVRHGPLDSQAMQSTGFPGIQEQIKRIQSQGTVYVPEVDGLLSAIFAVMETTAPPAEKFAANDVFREEHSTVLAELVGRTARSAVSQLKAAEEGLKLIKALEPQVRARRVGGKQLVDLAEDDDDDERDHREG